MAKPTKHKTFEELFPAYPKSEDDMNRKIAKMDFELLAKRLNLTIEEDGQDLILVFPSADDFSMFIRHDLNENLEVVYQGRIVTYCPEVIRVTEYDSGILTTLENLSKLYKEFRK